MGEDKERNLPIVTQRGEPHLIGRGNGNALTGETDTAQTSVQSDRDWLAVTLAALASAYQVPGAQLAVHRNGVTITAEVGDLEYGLGIPITRQTAFPTGSISKVWTATLAMILVADGDLELDAPLEDYLPELGYLGSKLTLCHLLSHTSGFASSPDTPALSTLSPGRYVHQHCRWQDLILPPGTAFSYSSRNYALVGHLIETITGMNWSEAVESILLRPLGVDLATVVKAPRERAIATGHSVNVALGRTRTVQQSLAPAEAPAGALAMSAADLVALGLMHIGSGVPALLPAAYAKRMRQALPGADPFGLADGWGLGLAVFRGATTDWVGHDGNANGTSCYLRIDPAGECVVALNTNANTGSPLWDELCIKLGLPDPPQMLRQRDNSARLEAASEELVGRYANGSVDYLVTAAGGELFLELGSELITRLVFCDGLDFLMQDSASGQRQHAGRFLRDPITKHIEYLQIGGRLASRRPLTVPEARSPADSISRVSV